MRFTKAFQEWATRLKLESLQRRKLGHLMKENGFSSSPWPTPLGCADKQGENDWDGKRGQTLIGAARDQNWPTPTAMDPEQTPEVLGARAKRMKAKHTGKNGTKHSGNGVGATLGTAIQQWPTPDVPNGGRSIPKDLDPMPGQSLYTEEGRKVQVGLDNAVKLWPTTQARDWKDGRSNQHGVNSRPLNEVVELWHTPRVVQPMEDPEKFVERMGDRSQDCTPNLTTQVDKWHTPLVQDSRNSGVQESRLKRETIELATQVQTIDGPRDLAFGSLIGNPRVQLNPAWVAELMGTTLERIFFVGLEIP